LLSPNGKIKINIAVNEKVNWTLLNENHFFLATSPMSMTLHDGTILGRNTVVTSAKNETVKSSFATPFYKKKRVQDHYNTLTLVFTIISLSSSFVTKISFIKF
jgi:alpha-glucosidase